MAGRRRRSRSALLAERRNVDARWRWRTSDARGGLDRPARRRDSIGAAGGGRDRATLVAGDPLRARRRRRRGPRRRRQAAMRLLRTNGERHVASEAYRLDGEPACGADPLGPQRQSRAQPDHGLAHGAPRRFAVPRVACGDGPGAPAPAPWRPSHRTPAGRFGQRAPFTEGFDTADLREAAEFTTDTDAAPRLSRPRAQRVRAEDLVTSRCWISRGSPVRLGYLWLEHHRRPRLRAPLGCMLCRGARTGSARRSPAFTGSGAERSSSAAGNPNTPPTSARRRTSAARRSSTRNRKPTEPPPVRTRRHLCRSSPRRVVHSLRRLSRRHAPGATQGDLFQQGGAFVLRPGNG